MRLASRKNGSAHRIPSCGGGVSAYCIVRVAAGSSRRGPEVLDVNAVVRRVVQTLHNLYGCCTRRAVQRES